MHRFITCLLCLVALTCGAFGQTSWTRWGTAPVMPAGGTGAWDEYRCLPASVVETDTGYTLYYAGTSEIADWPVGVATSPDGYTWTRYEGNPLARPDGWSPYSPYTPAVVPDVGTGGWMLFATRYGASDLFDICRALSEDGIHWYMDPAEPVLEAGPQGAWDHAHLFLPSVFERQDTLWMTYLAFSQNQDSISGMGLAFSLDRGETWTRDSANPVFVPPPAPAWDHYFFDARVAQWNDTLFVMVYSAASSSAGLPSIGAATSPDLHQWTPAPRNPVLRRGTPSSWDNLFVYMPVLAKIDGQMAMYYCGVNSQGIGAVGLAVQTPSATPDIQISQSLPRPEVFLYPNPFNETATIRLYLPNPARVELSVWDILGRRVALLKNGPAMSGESVVTWNAAGFAGGTYYVRLDANGKQVVRPIRLVK